MGEAYYRFYQDEPDYFSALTQASTAMAEADESQTEEMLCSKSELMELMIGAIRQGLEDGTMNRERIADPVQTALYLRGALHGVILLCQSELGASGQEDEGNSAADAVVSAVMKSAAMLNVLLFGFGVIVVWSGRQVVISFYVLVC